MIITKREYNWVFILIIGLFLAVSCGDEEDDCDQDQETSEVVEEIGTIADVASENAALSTLVELATMPT